jgi:hypothetical protein
MMISDKEGIESLSTPALYGMPLENAVDINKSNIMAINIENAVMDTRIRSYLFSTEPNA